MLKLMTDYHVKRMGTCYASLSIPGWLLWWGVKVHGESYVPNGGDRFV